MPATPDSPAATPSAVPSADPSLSPATLAVSAGRPPRSPDAPLNPPLVLASTYHAGGEVGYGRYGNPTWEMLESAVGALDGGAATAFSSGLAAVAAVLELVPTGGVVVTAPDAYYGSVKLLRRLESQGRLRVRLADLTDLAAVADAVPGATIVWAESPTNPMLRVVDLTGVARLAAEAGAMLVVDSTFATPILQRPLETGADVVVHSATKYLSGHSDLLLGIAVARDVEVAGLLVEARGVLGAVPSAFDAWLALRGLRTLHLRVERAQANAAELARRLEGQPVVSRVHYPGWGAMVSVELDLPPARVEAVVGSTRLWVHATSLGGVESSWERRRRWPGESSDVPESLVRLSVGVEDVEDLWADLDAALSVLG